MTLIVYYFILIIEGCESLRYTSKKGLKMTTETREIKFITTHDYSSQIEEFVSKQKKKFEKAGAILSYSKEECKKTIQDNYGFEKAIDALQIIINIETPVLKHKGWSYIGTIKKESVESGEKQVNMLYSLGEGEEIAKYKDLEYFHCDHCNTKHWRNVTNVFRNEEGKEIMIGTACSKEYFGIDVHAQLSNLLGLYPKIKGLCEDFEMSFGGGWSKGLDKELFCSLVYGIITKEKRYVSKSSVDEYSNDIPTSSIVSYLMSSTLKKEEIENNQREIKNICESLKDRDIYKEVRAYWDNKEDDSIFALNVKHNFKLIEAKEGLLAYAVWEYMREVEDFTGKKKFEERKKKSGYIGEVGTKILGKEVVITNFYSFDSQYGTIFIVSMIDDDDNVIIWKTSSPVGEKDERRTIKTAIIKDHKEYNGIKQTIVKNLKFLPID